MDDAATCVLPQTLLQDDAGRIGHFYDPGAFVRRLLLIIIIASIPFWSPF